MLLALILACEGGLFGPSDEELLAEDNDADGFIVDELIMPVEIDADGRWRCTFDFALEAAG